MCAKSIFGDIVDKYDEVGVAHRDRRSEVPISDGLVGKCFFGRASHADLAAGQPGSAHVHANAISADQIEGKDARAGFHVNTVALQVAVVAH